MAHNNHFIINNRCKMIKLNVLILVFGCLASYGWALPVSELAGMHQLDEGLNIDVSNKSICDGKPDGKMIGDPNDKTLFYECDNGIAFPFHCPAGLIFNEDKSQCEFDPLSPTKRPPYHGNSTFDCTGKQDGFYPDEKDRTVFHECVDGYPYDFKCPPTTIFDPRLKACSYDSNSSTKMPTTNRVNREVESTSLAPQENGESATQKHQVRPERSLEEKAIEKHIDLHLIETTTSEKFDIWID